MTVSINKTRASLALISAGALLLIAALIMLVSSESQQIKKLEVKMHAVPVHPVAIKLISPTATPTAALKFVPSKGIVK